MWASESFPQFNSESLNSAVSILQLQKIIARVMTQYNFHYYSLYKQSPYPLTRKKSCCLNCFDDDFNIDNETHNHLLEHMESLSSVIGATPLSWQYNLKETLPEVWEYFLEKGGRIGYSTICKTKKREKVVCSFFGVDRYHTINTKGVNEAELFASSVSIANKYSDLAEEGSDVPSLSSREIEILRWASEGKTSSDIASILHLSISTINFHMRNSLEKLAVSNKVAAIAKAICYNMI